MLVAPKYSSLAASEQQESAPKKTVLRQKTRVGVFWIQGPGQNLGEWSRTSETAPTCTILSYESASGRSDFCNGDPVNSFDPDGRFAGTPLSAGEYFSAVGSGLWTGAGNVGYAAVTAPYRFGTTVVSGYQQLGGLIGDGLTGNSGFVDMMSHPVNTLQASGNVAVDTAVGIGRGVYQQAQTSEGLATLSTDLGFGLLMGNLTPNTTMVEQPLRQLTEEEAALYARPSNLRAGVRDQIWNDNIAPNGNVYDSSGMQITPGDPWEAGHLPEYKLDTWQRTAADQQWTRQQWLDFQNDPGIYRPELSWSNDGHYFENGDWENPITYVRQQSPSAGWSGTATHCQW